jgi:hypothetical protein
MWHMADSTPLARHTVVTIRTHQMTTETAALTKVIEALRSLNSEERRRTVESAMVFLGEQTSSLKKTAKDTGSGEIASDDRFSMAAGKWMQKYDISADELDQVFHVADDGSFDIHDVPGSSKKDKTLNTYILVGLGKFLTTGEQSFDDSMARHLCENLGCYDAANHAAHLRKYRGPELTGNKKKGYTLTAAGLKGAAAIVKQLAGANK